MEGFEVRQVVESARHWRRIGLLTALVISMCWMNAAQVARSLDAGRASVSHVLGSTRRPLGYVGNVLFLGAYLKIGTQGLHVAFAVLLMAAFGAAGYGALRLRALERRFGKRALLDLESDYLTSDLERQIADSPRLTMAARASGRRDLINAGTAAGGSERQPMRRGARHPLLVAMYVAFVTWPYLALAGTAWFVWLAVAPS